LWEKGKLEEIKKYIQGHNITLVIFDDELTGSQITNIEKVLMVPTIDRSDLILDIFARRAQTAQARTQVELAQISIPLTEAQKGCGRTWKRQGGGIGYKRVRVKRKLKRTDVL
jgi:GTP-binding protein HflX